MQNPSVARLVFILSLSFISLVHAALIPSSSLIPPPSALIPSSSQICSSISPTMSLGQLVGLYSSTTDYSSNALAALAGNSIGFSLLALIASFDIIGIGYILGRIVPATNVRNWLAREYWEVIKSALLIASIYAIITSMSSVGIAISGGSPSNNYITNIATLVYSAEKYLCSVNTATDRALNGLVPVFFSESVLVSVRINFQGFPIPVGVPPAAVIFRSGVRFNLFANFIITPNIIFLSTFQSLPNEFLLFLVFPLKVLYSVQIFLLPIIAAIGLSFLIPIGLVMRAVPFLRGMGGTLIAFGFGMAVIWPSTLVVLNAPVSSYFYSLLTPAFQPPTSTCAGFGFARYVCSAIASISTGGAFNIALSSINRLYVYLNYFLQYTLYLILQLFILLILDILIAYPLTDNVARMLGGTIRLRLGGKLKLV